MLRRNELVSEVAKVLAVYESTLKRGEMTHHDLATHIVGRVLSLLQGNSYALPRKGMSIDHWKQDEA
jgi:hypothetical protein